MWRRYNAYKSDHVTEGTTWLPEPAKYLGPTEFAAAGHIVETMVRRDLTLIAIALERYRLAQGTFPGSLKQLVPEYLEAETIYDRMTDASYLYSVETDSYEISGSTCPEAERYGMEEIAYSPSSFNSMASDQDAQLVP